MIMRLFRAALGDAITGEQKRSSAAVQHGRQIADGCQTKQTQDAQQRRVNLAPSYKERTLT